MAVLESIVIANFFPFTSTLTFIAIPLYQRPNNDGSCFFSVRCPRGWLSSFRGGCFKVHSKPLNWTSAKSACEARGSSLAVLNSKAKLREFAQLLNSTGAIKFWWIGVYRDPQNERRWLQDNGSTAFFTFWHTGQPNNDGSNQDCVEIAMWSGEWQWNDRECGYRRPYICEINGKYNIRHEHIYNWWFETGFKPRGYSTNVYTRRLRPWFSRKRYPFRIPSIDKWYLLHICLELCIPFNCCKCTIY